VTLFAVFKRRQLAEWIRQGMRAFNAIQHKNKMSDNSV
jgi:hypothetical protein